MKRRQFIQALSAGVAGCSALLGKPASAAIVSVQHYGARGDGVHDDTIPLWHALTRNVTGTVLVPAGDYILNNPIYIQGFSGTLQFLAGARFVFTNPLLPGFSFQGGTGAVIENYRCGWKAPGSFRNGSSAGLQLDRTTGTTVSGAVIENSNGAGVLCWICKTPTITDASVNNTLSDGIHFANCEDGVVLNSRVVNSGDDGIAFVNYSGQLNHTGGVARNVTVTNSASRGISVIGQSDVQVSGFTVNGTSSSGVLCATDYTYDSRVPANVVFSTGTIQNAGKLQPAKGNQYGVEISHVHSASVSAVTTTGSGSRGVSVWAPNGTVALSNITVSSPVRDAGANLQARTLIIDLLKTENTNGCGIYIGNCGSVVAKRLQVVNASRGSELRRALWIEDNGDIYLQSIEITDNQASPTGYVLGVYGPQRGRIQGIVSTFANSRSLHLDNGTSPAVSVLE